MEEELSMLQAKISRLLMSAGDLLMSAKYISVNS
jgi:hypothetical protein